MDFDLEAQSEGDSAGALEATGGYYGAGIGGAGGSVTINGGTVTATGVPMAFVNWAKRTTLRWRASSSLLRFRRSGGRLTPQSPLAAP